MSSGEKSGRRVRKVTTPPPPPPPKAAHPEPTLDMAKESGPAVNGKSFSRVLRSLAGKVPSCCPSAFYLPSTLFSLLQQ